MKLSVFSRHFEAYMWNTRNGILIGRHSIATHRDSILKRRLNIRSRYVLQIPQVSHEDVQVRKYPLLVLLQFHNLNLLTAQLYPEGFSYK